MRLRHALIPYIYTMAWRNYNTALPLITPLYYTNPDNEDLYTFAAYSTYWFGSELIAAPFTKPAHPETGLSRQNIWLPEGDWFDFFTGERQPGKGWQAVYGVLDDIPVFAKAGAIVPLGSEVGWGGVENPVTMELMIFPGADNIFELFEDDGETTDYQRGEYALTKVEQIWSGDSLILTISPATGATEFIPEKRNYILKFRGVAAPEQISITRNDVTLTPEFTYHAETLELASIRLEPCDELVVTLKGDLLAPRDRLSEKLHKFLYQFKMDSWDKAEIARDWAQIAAGERSLSRYRNLTDAQRQVLEGLL
jgi:hypothetical protein